MTQRSQLQRELEQFAPADEREATFRTRMLELAQAPEDPFSREHYQPGHFTASAFVLSPDQSELLLIFHGKLKRWLQPGGHFEATDADTLAAATRELLEETGLGELQPVGTGLFDVDIHTIPARGASPAHEHFDLRYLFVATTTAFRAGSDALAARWVALDQVHSLESDESVQRAVRKIAQR